MNNKEAQKDELIVLESIYDKNVLFIDRSTEFASGRFLAQPVLPDSYCVNFKDYDKNGFSKIISVNIKYLPPINLHFELHAFYPSRQNPAFLITCEWLQLKQLELLCQHLEQLWKDSQNEVILYIWMQFLQDDALSHLGLQDSLMISSLLGWDNSLSSTNRSYQNRQNTGYYASKQNRYNRQFSDPSVHRNIKYWNKCDQQAHSSSCDRDLSHVQTKKSEICDASWKMPCRNNFFPHINRGFKKHDSRALCLRFPKIILVRRLKGYNERKLKESYENEWFTCDVCMEEKQGRFFIRFSECQHMYCKDCMKSYFEVQINDGTVSSITCPKEKCSTQALPSQIRELVGPDLYARYDKLLLTAILDTMTDVMYCPRLFCQCPVMLEPDRSMAICPSCQFVFCIYCKMVYHGVASCKFKKEERLQIREEYLNSNKEEKELMEQRYGRRSLQMLVDETLSEEWLETNSKKCPDCGSSIEKFEGCNKVTCWRCGSYFCWLCMTKLKTANPYSHYSESNSPCYNRLFQGVEFEDDDDWEVGAFL